MPRNLFEFYSQRGEALPSVDARRPLAESAGITNYIGSATQNQALLSFLTAGSNPVSPSPQPATQTAPATNPIDSFFSALSQRMLNESGAISSEDTNVEQRIRDAIKQTERGRDAAAERIESVFGRDIEGARERGEREIASFRESRRGFATNTAATRQITEAAEKRVKDLEQRREELILLGESQAAGQISNLILKELEFEQESRMRNFSNILQMGNFALKALEAQSSLGASGLKASDVQTFTDEQGRVTAKNKITGETLWTAPVGRAGSASPNISLEPVPDRITGNVKYVQETDRDTGEIRYRDASTGEYVDPSKVQIDKPADAIDELINEVLGGIDIDV